MTPPAAGPVLTSPAAPAGSGGFPRTGVRREASVPAEIRGAGRDDVALLVAGRREGELRPLRFPELAAVLRPGDALVVNNSATVPAALDAAGSDGRAWRLHISGRLPGDLWAVEPRVPAGPTSAAALDSEPGPRLDLPGGHRAHLLERAWDSRRLWIAKLSLPVGTVAGYLDRHGQPIRYSYVSRPWPIQAYQSVFSLCPGSAEMPSAARPFTTGAVTALVSSGIEVVPVTLHTGVSSLEAGEAPYPEWVEVSLGAADRINRVKAAGGRVVAVGTTVVRAIESAADRAGRLHPWRGWTDLVIGAARDVAVVDGLLTGWHEPESTHLDMLEAIGGAELVARSYRAAMDAGYLWHEFGDVHLILP
ncbi:MAG TPA: S-adenosylmethionine:tRNA ribosyltransferase-isomerase [Acidimicrobiales bacterium]|nr:S-adenosylmethionine:tRNA ribosyltransferase-isomerase [Acidimicrobiales bacterium]